MFCNTTVPLARMQKMVYRSGETFKAMVEIAHFGDSPIKNAEIVCKVTDPGGQILRKEIMTMDEIKIGNGVPAGQFAMDIPATFSAQKLTFEVSITGTPFVNRWNIWVYPDIGKVDPGNVYVSDQLDERAEDVLNKGGSVLLLAYGNVARTKGAEVAIGFSSIFWNTAWTNNQAPHTLGLLCDPGHPVFKEFPTEYHSNWQWWDPVSHSRVMILDNFPAELKPLIQPIDTWFENRRLALAFETKTGGGKLMVCSIDLDNLQEERLVSKQLLSSILNYMSSDSFNPGINVEINFIRALLKDQ